MMGLRVITLVKVSCPRCSRSIPKASLRRARVCGMCMHELSTDAEAYRVWHGEQRIKEWVVYCPSGIFSTAAYASLADISHRAANHRLNKMLRYKVVVSHGFKYSVGRKLIWELSK